jgi:hypothetical protein
MDSNMLNGLKGRIAESLVESIFRRAGYTVALVGREGRLRLQLRLAPAEFLPDMLVWRPVPSVDPESACPRLIPIEVKYRTDVEASLSWYQTSLARGAEQWRDLHFVFVTDHPEPGRSCFQIVDLDRCAPGKPWVTMDLHEAPDLDIYRRSVEEYESLVKLLFLILSTRRMQSRKLTEKLADPVASVASR